VRRPAPSSHGRVRFLGSRGTADTGRAASACFRPALTSLPRWPIVKIQPRIKEGTPSPAPRERLAVRRPVIGIVTQTLASIPGQTPLSWVMGQKYVRAFTAEGGVPWVVPLIQGDEETLRCIYERLDGIFLMGGVDMDPVQYGEERLPVCGQTDPA